MFTSNDTPPVSFLITTPSTAIATHKMWIVGMTKTIAGFCTNARDEFIAFSSRRMNGESLEKIDPERGKFSYQFCFASR